MLIRQLSRQKYNRRRSERLPNAFLICMYIYMYKYIRMIGNSWMRVNKAKFFSRVQKPSIFCCIYCKYIYANVNIYMSGINCDAVVISQPVFAQSLLSVNFRKNMLICLNIPVVRLQKFAQPCICELIYHSWHLDADAS